MEILFYMVMYGYWCSFFVFKQKTAYDMRISDWSSAVCSSDLLFRVLLYDLGALLHRGGAHAALHLVEVDHLVDLGGHVLAGAAVIADAGRHHRGGIAWKARIGAAVRPGAGGMAGAGRQHAGGGLCGILVALEQRPEEHTTEVKSIKRNA